MAETWTDADVTRYFADRFEAYWGGPDELCTRCLEVGSCSCIRCAECEEKAGDCPDDCGEASHDPACPMPAEPCRCAAIGKAWRERAADKAADMAYEQSREDREC